MLRHPLGSAVQRAHGVPFGLKPLLRRFGLTPWERSRRLVPKTVLLSAVARPNASSITAVQSSEGSSSRRKQASPSTRRSTRSAASALSTLPRVLVNGGWWLVRALLYSYAILLILLVVWQCAFGNWPLSNGDVELYHRYASAFWSTSHRFASLPAEYPPLATLVFSLTLLPELPLVPPVASVGQTGALSVVLSRAAGFAVWMGLFVLLTFFVCWWLTNQRRAWVCLAYLCIGGGGVLLTRFDVVPALAVVLAFAAARKRWFPLAFLLLAVGTALKLYPIFLVPLFAAYQWRVIHNGAPADGEAAGAENAGVAEHEHAQTTSTGRALAAVAGSVGVCVVFLAANLVIGDWLAPPQGALTFIGYARFRPLQIESFPATLMWLASGFGLPAVAKFSFSSFNLVGPADGVFIALSYAGLVLGCLLTYWRVVTGKLGFGRGAIAVIAIVIVTGKVFSPQYLIWLVPLVAIVEGFDWMWLSICLLTALDYPILYHAFAPTMMTQYAPILLIVIAARNILLVLAIMRLFVRMPMSTVWPRRERRAPGKASAELADQRP